MSFSGFPVAALDFYDDLEVDNTRSFWEANKQVYLDAVRSPMVELAKALEPEFGEAKVFRPHRDVRFSKDKTPYKTHQGAFVAVAPHTGYYVQISAQGLFTAGGFYHADPAQLSAYRDAVAGRAGAALAREVRALDEAEFSIDGDRLVRVPRGFDRDHARADLLRHRTLTVSRDHGFADAIHTGGLLDLVRDDWSTLRPLVTWLSKRLDV